MAYLETQSLGKKFADVIALCDVSLEIESGEFVTLLGPSGCGKTTFLRILAGLERPTEGKVFLDGNCINEMPPHKRQMGMVVQNYALFPHMTVFDNVAYGLRVRGVGTAEQRRRVLEALDLVKLTGYEERYPRQLSGGEQQRCALARALVIQPSLLLLDEALGSLDKNLREEMQVELKQLQRTVKVTTLAVTHDQEEALGMSDRIVILNQGKVEQFGNPTELYESPKTEFVANFIGDANLFRGKIEYKRPDGLLVVQSNDGHELVLSADSDYLSPGSDVILLVRPEYAKVATKPTDQMDNVFAGFVDAVKYQGNSTKIVVRLESNRSLIILETSLHDGDKIGLYSIGEQVWVSWKPHANHVLKI